jgi:transcriptional regulator with XRE-family HTH domain
MLADAVKRYRAQKGLSQDKLSKLAGVTLATLVKIESGANDNPKLKTLKAIAAALEVSVCDLIEP